MKRFIKKITAGLMVVICIVTMSIPVSAESGYAKKSMNGSASYTKYDCTFWIRENFWDISWGAIGTSQTAWLGSEPFYADSITHTDILKCSGLGSMDVGIDSSTVGVSTTVSNHEVAHTYSVANDFVITVDFNYECTLLALLTDSLQMKTKAVVQLGSDFYVWYS